MVARQAAADRDRADDVLIPSHRAGREGNWGERGAGAVRPLTTRFRVDRCFAFLDLCGFTDYVDAEGDDAAVAELGRLRTAVREVAPLCGVRVDKWLGDGVMLVGVESPPVVNAVLAVGQRFHTAHTHLALRAGVAAGPVILLEGDDYIGRPVNLAARLVDIADPFTVLAAPSETLRLPDDVTTVPAGDIVVKGFALPVEVVSVDATRASERFDGRRRGLGGLRLPSLDQLLHPRHRG